MPSRKRVSLHFGPPTERSAGWFLRIVPTSLVSTKRKKEIIVVQRRGMRPLHMHFLKMPGAYP
jgi:hypothetical protein